MSERKYSQEEIFPLPWVLDKHGQSGLSLSRVGVVYKIKGLVTVVDEKYIQRFHLWVRCQNHDPYKLGIYFSLTEAKFRAYDHILYFDIYLDGQWDPLNRGTKYELE